ncbi:MAG: hypothetical protein NUV76_10770 [Candidatus Kuenenia sp.]|nr:hypothetical protein [Candidatus Kuenenia sp.]
MRLFRGRGAGSDVNNVAVLCVHGSCYAGDNLLEISKTKDVYMNDIDDKLVFIRDNVKMIDKEFNKLNNVLIHMDVMPS